MELGTTPIISSGMVFQVDLTGYQAYEVLIEASCLLERT